MLTSNSGTAEGPRDALSHSSLLLYEQVIAPWAARRYAPADVSSTRGGSTSVHSPDRSAVRISLVRGRPAAGSHRADNLGSCASLGWDRQTDGQTDGSQHRLIPHTFNWVLYFRV